MGYDPRELIVCASDCRTVKMWITADENGIDGIVRVFVLEHAGDEGEVEDTHSHYLVPYEVISELALDPCARGLADFLDWATELREKSYLKRVRRENENLRRSPDYLISGKRN